MLVQFALVVFALCGLLSAVIDIGYARLTQGQMQSAADAAALEGLRKRDVGIRNPVTNQVINDPFASDCLRRAAANRMVRRTFDDNFDTTDGDPYQLGAGPVMDMTEGVTTAHALQLVSVPETHVYKPDPQMNQQNAVYGDMVSGRFCYTSDPVPSEGGTYELQDIVCTEAQRGSGDYSRNDFNPNLTTPVGPPSLIECPAPDDTPPAPWPLGGTGSLGTEEDSAFLVRLRRSNEFQDFTGQAEANVGSSGPSLPLTFGKGTTIHGDTPDSQYSVRRDGLTVRATAISQVRPALHLGLPVTTPVAISTPVMARFTLRDACVQAPANAQATAPVTIAVTINPVTGIITRAAAGATPTCPANSMVGRFIATTDAAANAATFRNVGTPVPVANVAAPCATTTTFTGRYGSVFSAMTAGPNRVIGFTRINFTRVATCPVGVNAATAPYTATIVRQAPTVASANATAVLSGGFAAAIPPALVGELLQKNLRRTGVDYGPVLVATLAR